jgi:hypothetical protein
MTSAQDTPAARPEIRTLRGGMVGLGMIFDETYRPFFETVQRRPLYDASFGVCRVALAAVASRTGKRAEAYRQATAGRLGSFESFSEPGSVEKLLAAGVDFVCVATPDDRHFDAARKALAAGKHALVEKPSVLSLSELDELQGLARHNKVLCKVVYHTTTRSSARSSLTVRSSTSTTATVRSWNPKQSAKTSSRSGSPAAIPALMSRCTTSSSSTSPLAAA